MRKHLLCALAASTALFASMPAAATVLTADTGWRVDTITSPTAPSSKSAWTFTVGGSALFSLVDCCSAGDTYTLTGDLTGSSAFTGPGSPTDVQSDGQGEFGSIFSGLWQNGAYGRLTLAVGPGTYNFSIFGDGKGGLPADFGIRLDTVKAVPEPAS